MPINYIILYESYPILPRFHGSKPPEEDLPRAFRRAVLGPAAAGAQEAHLRRVLAERGVLQAGQFK